MKPPTLAKGGLPLRGRRRRQHNLIRASVLPRSREKTRHPAGRAPIWRCPPGPASAGGQGHGRRVRYKPAAHGGACRIAPLPSLFADRSGSRLVNVGL